MPYDAKILESETTESLQRAYSNTEATKAAIFLFVNRAYEARLPESEIGEIFGRCMVHASYSEQDEEPALAWLDFFASIASQVHQGDE